MKKPEEIKKGLETCVSEDGSCDDCPYAMEFRKDLYVCYSTKRAVMADALAYIQQLEREKDDLLEERELNDYLRDRVKQLEAQVPRWISVEERLPEIAEHRGKYDVSVRVLCACLQKSGRRMVKEGYFEIFDGKYFNWRIPGTIDKITHWMPLPEAPKEE